VIGDPADRLADAGRVEQQAERGQHLRQDRRPADVLEQPPAFVQWHCRRPRFEQGHADRKHQQRGDTEADDGGGAGLEQELAVAQLHLGQPGAEDRRDDRDHQRRQEELVAEAIGEAGFEFNRRANPTTTTAMASRTHMVPPGDATYAIIRPP
jgi:hypothetical protein